MSTAFDDARLAAFVLGDAPTEAATIAADPHLAARAERLRRVAAALTEAGAEPIEPPAGLVEATLAALPVLTRRTPSWRLADLTPAFNIAALLVIGLLTCSLGATAVAKVREAAQTAACQNRFRELFVALDGYADTHVGQYPQAAPTAGMAFVNLAQFGHLPTSDSTLASTCPGGGTYAYTLGYQTPTGRVVGLHRRDVGDLTPIAADLPGPPRPHVPGHTVLFVGGNVRLTTHTLIGAENDEIFSNQLGQSRAGLHRLDTSLGGPADRP